MRNLKKWMLAVILICGTTTMLTSRSDKDDNPAPKEFKSEVDYSDKNNWMRQPVATKDVDAFFVYPTEYDDPSEGAPKFADINEPNMRKPAEYAYLKIATAFEDCANVFAPYYRQGNMSYLGKITAEERNAAFNSIPKTDILAAIDYYFKHLNGGRPFILVGHSQGSIMQSFVLSEYMKVHPEYLERMVAAYVIGYSITEDFLKANPHLKFAEGADDTGVIISYNTEGAGTGTTLLFCQVPSASIPSTGSAMRPI